MKEERDKKVGEVLFSFRNELKKLYKKGLMRDKLPQHENILNQNIYALTKIIDEAREEIEKEVEEEMKERYNPRYEIG